MKELPKYLGEHLPPVKLFREDLEELYSLFKKTSDKVEIKGDGFEFNDIDDLFTYPKVEINELEFCIRSPYVCIHFKPDNIWLYSSDNTNLQYGLFAKIKTLLKKRRNLLFILISGYPGLFIGGILLNVGINFLPIHSLPLNMNDTQSLLRGFFFILLGIFWAIYSFRNMFKKHSQIYLVYKNSSNVSIFARYKDYIFTIVVTAISVIISHEWR